MFMALLAILSAPAMAYAAEDISVTIDGRRVVFGAQSPVIVDGRVLVPVRGVFEHLGFTVDWNDNLRRVTLTSDAHTVILTIGSADFTTNGRSHALDVPAQIIGGSTMIPMRAVIESVGYSVDWNAVTRTVIVSHRDAGLLTQRVFEHINQVRAQRDLRPFLWDGALAETAANISLHDVESRIWRTGANAAFASDFVPQGSAIPPTRVFVVSGGTFEAVAEAFLAQQLAMYHTLFGDNAARESLRTTHMGLGYQLRSDINGNEVHYITIVLGLDNATVAPFRLLENPFDIEALAWRGYSRDEILDKWEREILRLTNIERQNHGAPPVVWNDTLGRAARGHSRDLVENNMSGHVGSDGSRGGERAARAGWHTGISENVAGFTSTNPIMTLAPDFFVELWMSSPTHRNNLLYESHAYLGVGFYVIQYYREGTGGQNQLRTLSRATQKFSR